MTAVAIVVLCAVGGFMAGQALVILGEKATPWLERRARRTLED